MPGRPSGAGKKQQTGELGRTRKAAFGATAGGFVCDKGGETSHSNL